MVLLQFEMSRLVWFWLYDTQLKISLIYTFFDINNFRYDTVRVHWLPIKFRSVVPYTLPGYFHDHSSGIAQSRFPFAGVITFSLLESDRVMPFIRFQPFYYFTNQYDTVLAICLIRKVNLPAVHNQIAGQARFPNLRRRRSHEGQEQAKSTYDTVFLSMVTYKYNYLFSNH